MYMDNINQLNGDKAELTAIYYYSQLGFLVSKPMQHSPYYDIIIDDGKRVYKVEVKYTSSKKNKNSYVARLSTCTSRKGKNVVLKKISKYKTDLVFILDVENNVYEFDSKDLHNRTTVTVNRNIKNYKKTF